MGKIITIKNNKGGVGKSWLTLQLGHAFTLLEKEDGTSYKVLLLTSDSQNNILTFSGADNIKFYKTLEDFVRTGELNEIRIRENLFYVPLKNSNFSKRFREKLKISVEKLKDEYDLILIDSVPVLNIDQDFIELADKIVIPTYLDKATSEGIARLMDEVGVEKIKAIIPNRYMRSKKGDAMYNELKETLDGTGIYLTDPIKQSGIIHNLLEDGKTIWDTKSKDVEEFQVIIYQVAMELIECL
ncbi:chromosome partitioning protein [Cetobacterium ceti]|uniref:Chromosome partitioning protein n=1 Tax=Cetobacterium ceti TaxID=180163 RepID=A0A1T4R2P4_9FUSO|nr:ParA family protein [Cetobacterium ceti]SKA10011.1 chromosome partitioning protein [Cetobacterium ceti]